MTKPATRATLADAQPVLRAGQVAAVRVRAADELDAPRRDAHEGAAGAPVHAAAGQPELVPARTVLHRDEVAARGDPRPAHPHGPLRSHCCGEPADLRK